MGKSAANQELIYTLDYILNRCNEAEIEAVAAAVVRRRKAIAMMGNMPEIMDPKRMAKELSANLNIEGSIEGLKKSVRDYAIRIIRQQAPELTEEQVNELCKAWIPDLKSQSKPEQKPQQKTTGKTGKKSKEKNSKIPKDALASMINQFVLFSLGDMSDKEDKMLRDEMGKWPDKYWNAFPGLFQLLIRDFLQGEITRKEFNSRLEIALENF